MGGIGECYHTAAPPSAHDATRKALASRPFPLVRLRGLLQADRSLAVALPEAERLAVLNRRFAGVVPKAVARACRVAAIQGDTALVFCANGAAASRVRAQAGGARRLVLSRAAGKAGPAGGGPGLLPRPRGPPARGRPARRRGKAAGPPSQGLTVTIRP